MGEYTWAYKSVHAYKSRQIKSDGHGGHMLGLLVDVSLGRGCYCRLFMVECRHDGLYVKSASCVLASQQV